MLIERGDVIEIGEPHEIARAYNELQLRPARRRRAARGRPLRRPRDGRDHRRLVRGRRRRARSTSRRRASRSRSAWRSCSTRRSRTRSSRFNVRNEPRHTVFATSTDWNDGPDRQLRDGETASRVRVRFENWLAPMRYTVTPVGRPSPAPGADCARRARGPGGADRPRHARHGRHRRRPPLLLVRAHMSTQAVSQRPSVLGTTTRRLFGAHLDARHDRLQAALLRLRAGLRVDAGPPVRAVRRDLVRLRRDRRRSARASRTSPPTSCCR